MRVFFASDLHYDKSRGRASTEAMARYLCDVGTPEDVLWLGGDYANDDARLTECLRLFEGFAGEKLAIAGNHDVWTDDASNDPQSSASMRRYRDLSECFASAGFHALEDRAKCIQGVGFVGALGWYDYSFRVDALDLPMDVYRKKAMPESRGAVWNDARFVRWGRTDPEVTEWQFGRLEAQLESMTHADRLLVATHHVPTERLLRAELASVGDSSTPRGPAKVVDPQHVSGERALRIPPGALFHQDFGRVLWAYSPWTHCTQPLIDVRE